MARGGLDGRRPAAAGGRLGGRARSPLSALLLLLVLVVELGGAPAPGPAPVVPPQRVGAPVTAPVIATGLLAANLAFPGPSQEEQSDSAWLATLDRAMEAAPSPDEALARCEAALEEAQERGGAPLRAGVCQRALLVARGERRMGAVSDWADRGLADLPSDDVQWPYLLLLGAEAELVQGHWVAASERLTTLLEGCTSEERGGYRIQALGLAGAVALDLGRLASARELFDQELDLARDVAGRDPDQAHTLTTAHLHQVHLALASADAEGALTLTERFLDDPIYAGREDDRHKLQLNRAVALAEQTRAVPVGGREHAADTNEAAAVEPSAGAEHVAGPDEDAEALLTELATTSGNVGVAHRARVELARLACDRGAWDAAAEHLAQAPLGDRQHAVLSSVVARRTGTDLASTGQALVDELDEMVAGWRADALRPGGANRLQLVSARALVAEVVARDLADLGPERALGRLLELESAMTLVRRMDLPTATPAELSAALAPGQGVLIHLPLVWGGSTVLAVDANGVEAWPLASYHRVAPLRRAWLGLLQRGPRATDADIQRAAALALELAEALVPAGLRERMATWDAVSVLGLPSLPWAWLPGADGRPLGTTLAVEWWPSVAVGLHLRRRDPVVSGRPFDLRLVTDVTPDPRVVARWPHLAPLPAATALLEACEEVYGPARVDAWRGDGATVARLRSAADDAVVCQVLVHGVQEPGAERPAALVLEPAGTDQDGLLRCDDLEAARLAPFMVLLACASGQAGERQGDAGSNDLAGACLASGARAALVADLALGWRAAVDLSRELHRGLGEEGLGPAEALRRARARLVDEQGARAPFSDGALRLVGAGQRALFAPRPPDLTWWVPAGLALLAAVTLVLRARGRRGPPRRRRSGAAWEG